MEQKDLKAYFDFDDGDLQANRIGQLTERQNAYLAEDDKYDRIFGLIGAGFLFLLGAVILYFSLFVTYPHAQSASSKLTTVLLAIGAVAVFGGLGVRNVKRALTKFQVTVARAEGPVNIVKEQRSSTRADGTTSYSTVYEMHVGPNTFQADSALAGVMLQGDVYAVYYTQGSENKVVSAELLSKAQ